MREVTYKLVRGSFLRVHRRDRITLRREVMKLTLQFNQ